MLWSRSVLVKKLRHQIPRFPHVRCLLEVASVWNHHHVTSMLWPFASKTALHDQVVKLGGFPTLNNVQLREGHLSLSLCTSPSRLCKHLRPSSNQEFSK